MEIKFTVFTLSKSKHSLKKRYHSPSTQARGRGGLRLLQASSSKAKANQPIIFITLWLRRSLRTVWGWLLISVRSNSNIVREKLTPSLMSSQGLQILTRRADEDLDWWTASFYCISPQFWSNSYYYSIKQCVLSFKKKIFITSTPVVTCIRETRT